ncbi:MAG: phosphatase PAP2 family protein [Pseudomonadota bacterium]
MTFLRTLSLALALTYAAPTFAQTSLTPAQRQGAPIIEGVQFIGPPPAPDSAQAAADRLATHPQVSAERLAQAVSDETLDPWLAFHSIFGDSFTAARLPHTADLLRLVAVTAGPVIGATKGAQMRPRPFIADPSVVQCPLDESLRTQSSYPSGHSTIGYAWALVLAELAPSRADAILLRGREYGDSRVICGMHFPSDVRAGRLLASGIVARLHADPAFRRALDAARRELARAYPQ